MAYKPGVTLNPETVQAAAKARRKPATSATPAPVDIEEPTLAEAESRAISNGANFTTTTATTTTTFAREVARIPLAVLSASWIYDFMEEKKAPPAPAPTSEAGRPSLTRRLMDVPNRMPRRRSSVNNPPLPTEKETDRPPLPSVSRSKSLAGPKSRENVDATVNVTRGQGLLAPPVINTAGAALEIDESPHGPDSLFLDSSPVNTSIYSSRAPSIVRKGTKRGKSCRKIFNKSPTHPGLEEIDVDGGSPAMQTVAGTVAGPLARHEAPQLSPTGPKNLLKSPSQDELSRPKTCNPWQTFVQILTCCIPSTALRRIGRMPDAPVQQAWREKIALVFICMLLMATLAFITFGLQQMLCSYDVENDGWISWQMVKASEFQFGPSLVDPDTGEKTLFVFDGYAYSLLLKTKFSYDDTDNLVRFDWGVDSLVAQAQQVLLPYVGRDATMVLADYPEIIANVLPSCKIGKIKGEPVGCLLSNSFLYLSLTVILSLIMIKFVLAIYFGWFISHELGKLKDRRSRKLQRRREKEYALAAKRELEQIGSASSAKSKNELGTVASTNYSIHAIPSSVYTEEVYTVLLVTCYSEDQDGIKTTLDSLASTIYNDSKKLILIVADGQITGAGNTKTTPELVLELLDVDESFSIDPVSYEAVADGSKKHNMARVYAAHYHCDGHVVPTIFVSKCGTPEEASSSAKPGNRGKRDSQIILMSFFKKVTFNEPMSPLEYDMFAKVLGLMSVTPDRFEIVLMVDADTRVEPDSLSRLVAVMVRDPLVMGLCGETRIMNKSESWVSRIQVFEYYLSHHLQKTFESVFGCVTCLPGCFCMWRIKVRKPQGFWVPILCNPDIVETYSESVVDTLHKKNLLLLGEDRFLTTIMLRTFPRRKTMFVPASFCKTTVPAEFRVLLSQRRRWINSTIHNLMELVLIKELCGTFCFSMNFLIFVELVGTATLPAAITFTTYLLFYTGFTWPDIPIIPLALLGAILGLPAILILLTTKRVSYIYWCAVYLMALPVWNFLLPIYAYWHFDDFSWGQTRKVEGEEKGEGHGDSDGKTAASIPLKRWVEWETHRDSDQKEDLPLKRTPSFQMDPEAKRTSMDLAEQNRVSRGSPSKITVVVKEEGARIDNEEEWMSPGIAVKKPTNHVQRRSPTRSKYSEEEEG